MSPSKNDSATTASYVLILGSLLTIIPNLPVINESLPILNFQVLFLTGGTNLLGSFFTTGTNQGSFNSVKGWTMLGLSGDIMWLIFIAIGVIALIIAVGIKTKSMISMVGLIGGVVDTALAVLIYLGDAQDVNKYGLSNIGSSGLITIGLGFWLILLGSVIILVAGLLTLKK